MGSGLSMYRLAKESGVTAQSIGRFLRRERGLSTESLDKLDMVLRFRLEAKGPTKAVLKRQGGK